MRLAFAEGREKEFLDGTVPVDVEAVPERFDHLLSIALADGEHSELAAVKAEELAEQFGSELPGLRVPYSRLARTRTWRRVADITEGEGLRIIPVRGWVPDAPALKVRKALLHDLGENEQIVSGSDPLTVAFDSRQALLLEIRCRFERLDPLATRPVEMRCSLNDVETRRLVLTTSSPTATLRVALTPGKHLLRIELDDPVTNQYVRTELNLYDEHGGSNPRPLVHESQRNYHVASSDRPLRVHVQTPAWLRIDTVKRNGAKESSYRAVYEASEPIELRPEEGEDEALFRVFERVPADEPPDPEWVEPLPGVELDAPLPPAIDSFRATDTERERFSIDASELRQHTWSYGARFVRRRALEEDGEGDLKPDLYFELRLEHRFREERVGGSFRSALVARAHDEGGPSVGIIERALFQPRAWRGVALDLRGESYAQWLSGERFDCERRCVVVGRRKSRSLAQVSLESPLGSYARDRSLRAVRVDGPGLCGRFSDHGPGRIHDVQVVPPCRLVARGDSALLAVARRAMGAARRTHEQRRLQHREAGELGVSTVL